MGNPIPRHERSLNFKNLNSLRSKVGLRYLKGDNGKVICSVDDPYHNWFVPVPQYAFDAVARGSYTTVGELRKYIKKNPKPNEP